MAGHKSKLVWKVAAAKLHFRLRVPCSPTINNANKPTYQVSQISLIFRFSKKNIQRPGQKKRPRTGGGGSGIREINFTAPLLGGGGGKGRRREEKKGSYQTLALRTYNRQARIEFLGGIHARPDYPSSSPPSLAPETWRPNGETDTEILIAPRD